MNSNKTTCVSSSGGGDQNGSITRDEPSRIANQKYIMSIYPQRGILYTYSVCSKKNAGGIFAGVLQYVQYSYEWIESITSKFMPLSYYRY